MQKNLTPKCQTKLGFTLAEVLIVLAVIGVIAALTIPTLMTKYKEMETITRLRKVYSTFAQAYERATIFHDTPDHWNLVDTRSPEGAQNLLDNIAPYMIIAKKCGNNPGCFTQGYKKFLDGTDDIDIDARTDDTKFILANGVAISIIIVNKDCAMSRGPSTELSQICAIADIDINGYGPPYQNGRDIFTFYLTKDSVIPSGVSDETHYTLSRCFSQGMGCTAWAIYNQNLDYLHCSDLSWGGKTKCN